ncbi:hypothetical protein CC86DRAFT_333619 [Ophiobolus disseminans]|uniref:Ribosome biogenesis protein SLX9 n=1 Tax=Ophiobolus disseminans TaxID=1469910 RepID=A0A6A6ZHP8_9PLEO|nr:hypothetical protein CC86DRAFT_333619 [Ophiobolus disseminans]
MAPIKKRTTARAKSSRVARPTATATTSLPQPESLDSVFPSSKKDKQKIKHSSFVSKIEKSSSKSSKRRRPNKKLVANLESLADALSGLEGSGLDGKLETGQAKIHRKSLSARPGAMKRKAKLEKAEKERFNMNLAQLSGTQGGAIKDRWAALKSHVQSTTEVKPEFAKPQGAT